MFSTSLFPDKSTENLATAMTISKLDEYTDDCNSEQFKSTMYAHQLYPTSTSKNTDER